MPWEEMRRMSDEIKGLCIAVEGMRKDVRYLAHLYIPLTLLAMAALMLGMVCIFVTMDNRKLIQQQQEVVKEQLEVSP